MDTKPEPRFACDAMLGGLARWLRAAGYDASWQEGIDDWDLVRLARREGRVLLSSDTGIFRIGIVRDGEVPALFVPRGRPVQEQLAFVLQKFKLRLRPQRCMAILRAIGARRQGERREGRDGLEIRDLRCQCDHQRLRNRREQA